MCCIERFGEPAYVEPRQFLPKLSGCVTTSHPGEGSGRATPRDDTPCAQRPRRSSALRPQTPPKKAHGFQANAPTRPPFSKRTPTPVGNFPGASHQLLPRDFTQAFSDLPHGVPTGCVITQWGGADTTRSVLFILLALPAQGSCVGRIRSIGSTFWRAGLKQHLSSELVNLMFFVCPSCEQRNRTWLCREQARREQARRKRTYTSRLALRASKVASTRAPHLFCTIQQTPCDFHNVRRASQRHFASEGNATSRPELDVVGHGCPASGASPRRRAAMSRQGSPIRAPSGCGRRLSLQVVDAAEGSCGGAWRSPPDAARPCTR